MVNQKIDYTGFNNKLNDVFKILKQGLFEKALIQLNALFEIDYKHQGIEIGIKSIRFWLNRMDRIEKLEPGFEKGTYLIKEFDQFINFIDKENEYSQIIRKNIQSFIFQTALTNFLKAKEDNKLTIDISLYIQIAECYKVLAKYQKAISHFELARKYKKNDAYLLSQLADCYYLNGNEKFAKVLFNEALFIDPQSIDLNKIDADIIHNLLNDIKSNGYDQQELLEWIPIYAICLNVFNVKRELTKEELNRLKQETYSLEKEYEIKSNRFPFLVPRLINHYLRLLDNCLYIKKDVFQKKILLDKIKKMDKTIYDIFVKHNNV